MMIIIDQRYISFQIEILQTMKYLAIQIAPQLSNHYHSNLFSPPPHDFLQNQPPTYPHHGSFLHNSYPPTTTHSYPLTNMLTTTSNPQTPHAYIPPQSTQGRTPPPNQMLPPQLPPSQFSTNSHNQKSQSSFKRQ